jgi:1-acyl-sn-glycerol-3-phosphate acyltransferase
MDDLQSRRERSQEEQAADTPPDGSPEKSAVDTPPDRSREKSAADARPRRRHSEQQAEQAAAKAQERRSKQSGAAGWAADRASQWNLDGPDPSFMARQKYLWNLLMDVWFRLEVEGWENIPEPPVLLIGIHSGAPFVWDAWTIGAAWWRHFGNQRPLHGTAHDALMATPVVGSYFRRMGVLPATADSMSAALAAGHDVALWPGGERDSLRPWTQRDQAVLAGRKGFIKLAIRNGVPIVPISTVGGPDSMPVLASGKRLARLMKLDKVAQLKMFPIAMQLPWGISPALLPELPLPTKIRTAFGEPIEVRSNPELAEDEQYVQGKYDEVLAEIQRGMDRLARRRKLPLFG